MSTEAPPPSDDRVLLAALKVMTDALDALLGECLAPDGSIKAPPKQAVMKARSMLPAGYARSLTRKETP